MAFNTRQANFIADLQQYSKAAKDLYEASLNLNQQFLEEFDAGDDNDLSVMTTELDEWGLTFDAIDRLCRQFTAGVMAFWKNEPVTQREYGRYARRVGNQ